MSVKLYWLLLSILFFTNLSYSQELERRPFLGILMSSITDVIKSETGFGFDDGVYVRNVFDNSSAKTSKIKTSDIIYAVDGQKIKGVSSFITKLKNYNSGDVIDIMVFRNGYNIQKSLTLTPFPLESNPRFETLYSSIQTEHSKQRTIITKPKGKGPFPAIMLIQGVGCNSQEHPFEATKGVNYSLIDSLTMAGYVTMRIEKSGVGDSKGKSCQEIGFHEDVEGFIKGIRSLKEQTFVDAGKTAIIGFSMGGVIAPIIENKEKTKGIIVYGTVSSNWIEYELANTRRQYPLNHSSMDSLAFFMRLEHQRLNDFYVAKMNKNQILAKYSDQKHWIEDQMNAYPQHYSYFQEVADLNISDFWNNSTCNVLAVHGKYDFVSDSRDHLQIASITNRNRSGSGTHVELENADHWLKYVTSDADSKSKVGVPNPQYNYEFIKLCIDWLENNI